MVKRIAKTGRKAGAKALPSGVANSEAGRLGVAGTMPAQTSGSVPRAKYGYERIGTIGSGGRETKITQEIAHHIIEQMAGYGRTLHAVCNDPPESWPDGRKPGIMTVYAWRKANPAFEQDLALAREAAADGYVSRIIETTETMSNETVSVDRERIRSWQWLAKVSNPMAYGDAKNVTLTGADGGPVQIAQSINVDDMPEEARHMLRQAIAAARGNMAKTIDG